MTECFICGSDGETIKIYGDIEHCRSCYEYYKKCYEWLAEWDDLEVIE